MLEHQHKFAMKCCHLESTYVLGSTGLCLRHTKLPRSYKYLTSGFSAIKVFAKEGYSHVLVYFIFYAILPYLRGILIMIK